jgi:hypothetical protein
MHPLCLNKLSDCGEDSPRTQLVKRLTPLGASTKLVETGQPALVAAYYSPPSPKYELDTTKRNKQESETGEGAYLHCLTGQYQHKTKHTSQNEDRK